MQTPLTIRIGTALTSAPSSVKARQTTTIGDLLSQDMPCIPTTVDTTALKAAVATKAKTAAVPAGSAEAQSFWHTWLGSVVKDAWNTVKKAIINIVVDDVVEWTGVGEWIELALEGWNILTSADHSKVTATSPDGKTVKQYILKQPPKVPKDPPCGAGTRKMCP